MRRLSMEPAETCKKNSKISAWAARFRANTLHSLEKNDNSRLAFLRRLQEKKCQICDSGLSPIDLAKSSRVKNIQELKGLLFFAPKFLLWEKMLSSVF